MQEALSSIITATPVVLVGSAYYVKLMYYIQFGSPPPPPGQLSYY